MWTHRWLWNERDSILPLRRFTRVSCADKELDNFGEWHPPLQEDTRRATAIGQVVYKVGRHRSLVVGNENPTHLAPPIEE